MLQHRHRVCLGDLPLLVGGDDADGHLGAVAGRSPGRRCRRCAAASTAMPSRSSPASAAARTSGGVLADPGGEGDRVDPAEQRVVRPDVAGDPPAVDVEGQRSPPGPRRRGGRSTSRMSLSPVSPSRPLRWLSRSSMSSTAKPPSRRRWKMTVGSRSPLRVPITSPSSGDIPIEVATLRPPATAQALAPLPRCRVIVLSSSYGRPSSCRGAAGHVRVRGAVEAVPADAVPLGGGPVDGVRRGGLRAGCGGTRCRRRRPAARPGSSSPGDLDAGQVRRVVQRGERDQVLDRRQHRVVDAAPARLNRRAAVHHPVPDGGQPGQVQPVQDLPDGAGVVGRTAAGLADPLDGARGRGSARRRRGGTSPTTNRS